MATRPSFRDRLLTRAGAEAVLSPSGILLAGGATAVGILVGLPVVAAAGVGVAAWAAKVALGLPRGPARPRLPDARQLSSPWREFVAEAQAAADRFGATVDTVAPGPLADRLASVGQGIATGVEECHRVAAHGHTIDAALARLDTPGARRELAAARALPPSEPSRRTIEALEAQLATADRLAKASADGQARLRLLDARLDELVARAVELSVAQGDEPALSGLGTDVESLVAELEALRQAMEETSGPTATGRA